MEGTGSNFYFSNLSFNVFHTSLLSIHQGYGVTSTLHIGEMLGVPHIECLYVGNWLLGMWILGYLHIGKLVVGSYWSMCSLIHHHLPPWNFHPFGICRSNPSTASLTLAEGAMDTDLGRWCEKCGGTRCVLLPDRFPTLVVEPTNPFEKICAVVKIGS